jgi:predicted DsbA family dithiol-disulfide isomerase
LDSELSALRRLLETQRSAFAKDLALPVWVDVMNASRADFPSEPMKAPVSVEKMKVCRVSGQLATDKCVETTRVPGGQDITEHLAQKYGSTPEQHAAIRETIRQRGEELGFVFRLEGRDRIYNTFDAHRLLHWAGEGGPAGAQHALKKAFLASYQGRAEAIESHEVMLSAVQEAGLDVAQARAILESDTYAQDVKDTEQYYTQAGIRSVPAIIINQKHLISGGQPTEVFEQALRQIAQQEATV